MMLFNQEVALMWDFTYLDKVKLEVAPLQKIETIEYEAQQSPSFAYPKVLYMTIVQILKE